jgi:integrase/recombinase XerD
MFPYQYSLLLPLPLGMVTDAEGYVGDALHLLNGASKGKKGGRTVPLNATLRDALIALKARRNGVEPGDRIIHSERDIGMSPGAVQVWFHRLYEKLGLDGASSHSGRRPAATASGWRAGSKHVALRRM